MTAARRLLWSWSMPTILWTLSKHGAQLTCTVDPRDDGVYAHLTVNAWRCLSRRFQTPEDCLGWAGDAAQTAGVRLFGSARLSVQMGEGVAGITRAAGVWDFRGIVRLQRPDKSAAERRTPLVVGLNKDGGGL